MSEGDHDFYFFFNVYVVHTTDTVQGSHRKAVGLVSHMSQVFQAFSQPFAQGWIPGYSHRYAIPSCESFRVCSSSTCIFTISNSSCLDKMLRSHGPYLFPNWKWVIWNQLPKPAPTSKILFPQRNLCHTPEARFSSHVPFHVHLREDSWEGLKNLAQVNCFEY